MASTTKKEMLAELAVWEQDKKFPATPEAIAAVRTIFEKVKAKPQRIGITGMGGMHMRWDSPLYVFKLRIDAEGTLDDKVLKAINLLPVNSAGIYGAGGNPDQRG